MKEYISIESDEKPVGFSERKNEDFFSVAKKIGLISEKEGKLYFNIEALKKENRNSTNHKGMGLLNLLIDLASERVCINGKEAPLLTFPRNEREALSGIWSVGHYELRELIGVIRWSTEDIILEDGSAFSIVELFLAKMLNDLGVYRDQKTGNLLVNDKDGSIRKLSARYLKESNYQYLPSIKGEKFSHKPNSFIRKYAKKLINAGVFNETDFDPGTNIKEEDFIYKVKPLGDKPYISFSGVNGYANYYIGRNNFVGTSIERNENQKMASLDKNTVGIFESVHGGDLRLIAYFSLATKEEIENLYQPLLLQGFSQADVVRKANFGADFMDGRIIPYKPDVFCQRKKNESDSDYASRLVALNDQSYQMNVFRPMMKEAGLSLGDIKWEEQMVLFGVLLSQKNKDEILNFVKKFGTTGVRCFLSVDFFDIDGDVIFDFAKNYPDSAKVLFKKYSDIVDQSYNIENFINAELNNQITDKVELESIRSWVMSQAKDILITFIDAHKKAKENGLELSLDEVLADLQRIKADMILLSSALKNIKSKGESINVSDVKNFELTGHINPEKISPQDIDTMRQMYKENYDKYPELTKILLDSFEKSLEYADSEFTILRYKDDITGFYRIDTVNEKTIHFASFNVDRQFHGSGLGEAMMLSDLDLMAKDKKIIAECNPHVGISANYIERGFVATEWKPVAEIEVLNIERDDTNFDFVTKKESEGDWSQEKIVERFLRSKLEAGSGDSVDKSNNKSENDFYEYENGIRIYSAQTQNDFDFQKMLSYGNIVTRYFKFPKKGEKDNISWYIVTEKYKNKTQI